MSEEKELNKKPESVNFVWYIVVVIAVIFGLAESDNNERTVPIDTESSQLEISQQRLDTLQATLDEKEIHRNGLYSKYTQNQSLLETFRRENPFYFGILDGIEEGRKIMDSKDGEELIIRGLVDGFSNKAIIEYCNFHGRHECERLANQVNEIYKEGNNLVSEISAIDAEIAAIRTKMESTSQ